MKLFISQDKEHYYNNEYDYHWTDPSEILMFQNRIIKDSNNSVSMCGINSRKHTTNIVVFDVDIDKDLLIDYILTNELKRYNLKLKETFKEEATNLADELINKASPFEEGTLIKCVGRNVLKSE